jgi:hypothetical protein
MPLPPELEDLLAAREAPVSLWWRDDDAGRDDPRLGRLLDLSVRHKAAVALSVVPAWLDPAAIARVSSAELAIVLQHGISHANHAGEGQRKIELGGMAPPAHLADAARAGKERLAAAFPRQFRRVMVPPWNRLSAPVLATLPGAGFTGWSGWRDAPPDEPRLRRRDTHVDAIDWRGSRRCRESRELFRELAAQLRLRAREPLGILTHHLATDEAGFRSLDRFIGVVQDHPKLRIESAARIFAEAD